MKTLTSSCSKAIIGKSRGRGFSCFEDLSLSRAEVCLLPSKKLVRIRFLHLVSVQQGHLQPVFSCSSLSPDSQVDLETAETQPEDENAAKTIHVKFQLQKECLFGEQFFIVGDHPMLGLWDPESSIPLTWSEGHVWTVELDIPVGISIQFKFILKTSTGNLLWQPGPDRIFKSCKTDNMIIVCEDWEAAEYQKVIEEESLANQNGPLLDSDIAIIAENLTTLKEEVVSDINLVSDTDDSITFPGKEPLQALSEENGAPSLEKPLAIVAENISYPTEDFIANENKPQSHERERKRNEWQVRRRWRQQQQQGQRSSRISLRESGPFGLITNRSLNKAPLGVPLYAKFTPLTPWKNFGVCMIKYLSPASCLEMLISTCLRLELSPNGKILSVPMEESGLSLATERLISITCGLKP